MCHLIHLCISNAPRLEKYDLIREGVSQVLIQERVQKTRSFSWIIGFFDVLFQNIFPSAKSPIIVPPSPYNVVQALCIVFELGDPERRIESAY